MYKLFSSYSFPKRVKHPLIYASIWYCDIWYAFIVRIIVNIKETILCCINFAIVMSQFDWLCDVCRCVMSPTSGIYWVDLGFINNYKESQLWLVLLRYNADVANAFSWVVTEVFYLFIACPNAASYLSRISKRCRHSSIVAWQKMKLSSANNRWEMHTLFVHDRMPCNYCLSVAFLIRKKRYSTHNRKRYGERGSPCLIPRDGEVYPCGTPLMSTEYVAACTVAMASWAHLSSSPNLSMIALRKTHSTRL